MVSSTPRRRAIEKRSPSRNKNRPCAPSALALPNPPTSHTRMLRQSASISDRKSGEPYLCGLFVRFETYQYDVRTLCRLPIVGCTLAGRKKQSIKPTRRLGDPCWRRYRVPHLCTHLQSGTRAQATSAADSAGPPHMHPSHPSHPSHPRVLLPRSPRLPGRNPEHPMLPLHPWHPRPSYPPAPQAPLRRPHLYVAHRRPQSSRLSTPIGRLHPRHRRRETHESARRPHCQ